MRGFDAATAAKLRAHEAQTEEPVEPVDLSEYVRREDLGALFLDFLRSQKARTVIRAAGLLDSPTPLTHTLRGDGVDFLFTDGD